jgi:hypothetical protein
MSQGYMVIADDKPLESGRHETAARFLFKLGVADFGVKTTNNVMVTSHLRSMKHRRWL